MFSDLIAAEAVYHHNCRTRFLGFRSLDAGGVCGWPVSLELCYAFEQLCDWLEGCCEQNLFSLEELQEKMIQIAVNIIPGESSPECDICPIRLRISRENCLRSVVTFCSLLKLLVERMLFVSVPSVCV